MRFGGWSRHLKIWKIAKRRSAILQKLRRRDGAIRSWPLLHPRAYSPAKWSSTSWCWYGKDWYILCLNERFHEHSSLAHHELTARAVWARGSGHLRAGFLRKCNPHLILPSAKKRPCVYRVIDVSATTPALLQRCAHPVRCCMLFLLILVWR